MTESNSDDILDKFCFMVDFCLHSGSMPETGLSVNSLLIKVQRLFFGGAIADRLNVDFPSPEFLTAKFF